NLFRRVVPLAVLLCAEIWTGENLLHADDLHPFFRSLIEKLEMLLDVGFADFLQRLVGGARMRRLNQAAFDDTGHAAISLCFCRSLSDRLTPHQQPVNDETESESHEPRVRIQPVEEGGIADSSSRRRHRA